mmetsp:Transcript_37798/g.64503  ORF Transcript_37798/g.64503 Transcript_37798/m.64503 type:complete len:278 (-) Transcript_37798:210-1043(-)
MCQIRSTVTLRLDFLLTRLGLWHILTDRTKERQSGTIAQHLNRVVGTPTLQERRYTPNISHGSIHRRHIVPIARSDTLSKVLVEDIDTRGLFARLRLIPTSRGLSINLFKHTPRIEHARINLIGGNVPLTNQENLGGLTTTRGGFDGLHSPKELLRHPEVRAVILTTIQFGHERSVLLQVFRSTFQRVQCQFVLLVGILIVTRSDIRRTIAQYHIASGTLHLGTDGRLAFFRGNVSHQCNHILHGADGQNVHGDNGSGCGGWEGAGTDLRPTTGSGA